MTLTSADFPADGTCPEDVFSAPVPDDMQDVPLHGSTGNAAKAIKVARMPMMKFEAHLHSPPQFPAAHSESGLSVRVHTPETVQQTTMGIPLSHTVYHVESTSTLSTFPKSSCAVLRRFSDFDALYHVLRNKYTGYFIPPVPDKDLVQGKLRSDKSFLDKRTQDLEALQQFLTLSTDSLLQDPQWKRIEEEECVFHSISVLRRTTMTSIPSDGLTSVPTAQASSTSTSATITKLGTSLMSGMSYITGKVKSNILPVSAADAVPASPPAVEATQRGETLSMRASAADCLLLRWAQAAHALHSAGLSAQALASELHRLWAYEDKASAHVKLSPRAREVISYEKRLSYAAAHVGKGTEAFAKAGDGAAAPLKVVASGLHAGRRALDDRCMLRTAIADAQNTVQARRERYRVHSEVSPSEARPTGVDDALRTIGKLDGRLSEMKDDYSSMVDIHNAEMRTLEAKATACTPRGVEQIAQLLESLATSSASQWEALAQSLGASPEDLKS